MGFILTFRHILHPLVDKLECRIVRSDRLINVSSGQGPYTHMNNVVAGSTKF